MPDTRSAFESCAARRASSGSASTAPAIWKRQLRDPLDALLLRAELLVERDAVERIRHLVERALQVLLPEELGVREPRADHALVAGDDRRAAVLGREVRDRKKLVRELLRLVIA